MTSSPRNSVAINNSGTISGGIMKSGIREILPVESAIWDTAQGIRNPTNVKNSEYKFH